MVQSSVARGAIVAVVGYDLALKCAITELVKQVATAIKVIIIVA